MQQRQREHAHRSALVLVTMALALITGLPAGAAEPASFKWLPADVSYYSTMLRSREQSQAIVQSKAWAKLMSVPFVKQALAKLESELKNNPQQADFQKLLAQPENAELVEVLSHLLDEEAFLAGGENWGDFVDLVTKVYSAYNYGPLKMIGSGKATFLDNMNLLQGRAVLAALADNTKLLKVPDILVGFKVHDPKKAENQLKRLDGLTQLVGILVPPLKGKFKRIKIGTGTFQSVTLDGSMIPIEQLLFDDFDIDKEQVKKVVAAVKEATLTINIGVSGDYVLLSIGSSMGLLPKLGGKGDKLGDRDELKPLAKYSDKLLSVSYLSRAVRQRGQADTNDTESMVDLAKGLLDQAGLEEQQKKKILKDMANLLAASRKDLPEFGAFLDFSFSSPVGQEGYAIDYGKYPGQPRPKPLTLLNHLGRAPILGGVFRTEVDVESYNNFAKQVQIVYGHADTIAMSKLDGDVKDQYVKITKAVLPLVKRWDEITRTLYLPALAEGQTGLVIDAKWKSKQWSKFLEETPAALPMLEIGIVIGISDADKLVKAVASYGRLAEEAVGVVRELVPLPIPELKIPPPDSVKKPGGTLYSYTLPEMLDLDRARGADRRGGGKSGRSNPVAPARGATADQ